jgi:uncharacterized protein (DUF1786 family)
VLGFFEHHTSELSLDYLEILLEKLVNRTLQKEEIWNRGGHGVFIKKKGEKPFIVTSGPRRLLMSNSKLTPHFASPFGSMMLVGCFGLFLGLSTKFANLRDEIDQVLTAQN